MMILQIYYLANLIDLLRVLVSDIDATVLLVVDNAYLRPIFRAVLFHEFDLGEVDIGGIALAIANTRIIQHLYDLVFQLVLWIVVDNERLVQAQHAIRERLIRVTTASLVQRILADLTLIASKIRLTKAISTIAMTLTRAQRRL